VKPIIQEQTKQPRLWRVPSKKVWKWVKKPIEEVDPFDILSQELTVADN